MRNRFYSRYYIIIAVLIVTKTAKAQELFVYTEPASNMPAKSAGVRINNWLMQEGSSGAINYHFIPEIMWGVNKKVMVHLEGFVSNRNKRFSPEGGALYVKYRFFSKDEVFRHFRLAVSTRVAINNSNIHQAEIETNGHNSGYELGIIATQLLHRQAISASLSYERAYNNAGGNDFPKSLANKAINYTLSTGRLLFPKNYANYSQTNFNIMSEMLGQYLPDNGSSFMDISCSIQFIFNSQTRVDIGYKKQVYTNIPRTASNGFLIRVEHLLFNVVR